MADHTKALADALERTERQLRHLIEEVTQPNPTNPGDVRIRPGMGVVFANMVNASAVDAERAREALAAYRAATDKQSLTVGDADDFTDWGRAAVAWVLWHHQGGSSAIGQPLRFALGLGAHEPLPAHLVASAQEWAKSVGATTAEFHQQKAQSAAQAEPVAPVAWRIHPDERAIAGVRLKRHADGSFTAETEDLWMTVDPRDDDEANYVGELVSVLEALWLASSNPPAQGVDPCNCPNIGACDGSCAPYVGQKSDPAAQPMPFDLTDARSIVVDAIRRLRAAHAPSGDLERKAEAFLEATNAAAKADELWDQTLRERDRYHEVADDLAQAIAKHLGVDIGEHSSANCPWEEALEALAQAQKEQQP